MELLEGNIFIWRFSQLQLQILQYYVQSTDIILDKNLAFNVTSILHMIGKKILGFRDFLCY